MTNKQREQDNYIIGRFRIDPKKLRAVLPDIVIDRLFEEWNKGNGIPQDEQKRQLLLLLD